MSFVAHSHTPHDCCVRFASAVTDGRATLAASWPATALPGPDFHRLDRASLTWRTGPNTRAGSIRSAVRRSHSARVKPVALIENRTMLLCDHLCRLIGWMVSDLVRSRATLEAEIWTLLQK